MIFIESGELLHSQWSTHCSVARPLWRELLWAEDLKIVKFISEKSRKTKSCRTFRSQKLSKVQKPWIKFNSSLCVQCLTIQISSHSRWLDSTIRSSARDQFRRKQTWKFARLSELLSCRRIGDFSVAHSLSLSITNTFLSFAQITSRLENFPRNLFSCSIHFLKIYASKIFLFVFPISKPKLLSNDLLAKEPWRKCLNLPVAQWTPPKTHSTSTCPLRVI